MTQAKHTATPWTVGGHPGNNSGTQWRTVLANGAFGEMYVAEALAQDAEFIVKACNAHDDLVLTLREAVARIEIANRDGNSILSAWLPDAKKVLAKAGY